LLDLRSGPYQTALKGPKDCGRPFLGYDLWGEKESHVVRKLLVTFVLFAVLAVGAGSATATPPATATGSFMFLTDTYTPIRTAGCVTFANEAATIVYTSGGLTGPASDTDLSITYCDGSFAGVHGIEVCSGCTLDNRTGDFTAEFVYRGSGANYTGTFTVISASGGLAGLHLQGTFQGDPSGNTYSYNYHFDPS
jgi:hypothetical protein